jgi:hypothetical protein
LRKWRESCTVFALVMTEPRTALPRFSADPYEWFDRVRAELVARRSWEILDSVDPGSWTDDRGHTWRVVRTESGIEVRPELQEPFLRIGESPKVTAIAINHDAIEVELSARSGRWVDRFPCDSFDVSALGRAMLDEHELPHDNLPRLFPRSDR